MDKFIKEFSQKSSEPDNRNSMDPRFMVTNSESIDPIRGPSITGPRRRSPRTVALLDSNNNHNHNINSNNHDIPEGQGFNSAFGTRRNQHNHHESRSTSTFYQTSNVDFEQLIQPNSSLHHQPSRDHQQYPYSNYSKGAQPEINIYSLYYQVQMLDERLRIVEATCFENGRLYQAKSSSPLSQALGGAEGSRPRRATTIRSSSKGIIKRGDLDRACVPLLETSPHPTNAMQNEAVHMLEVRFHDTDRRQILSMVRRWFRKRREEMSQRIFGTCKRIFPTLESGSSGEQPLSTEAVVERLHRDQSLVDRIRIESNLEVVNDEAARQYCREKDNIRLLHLYKDIIEPNEEQVVINDYRYPDACYAVVQSFLHSYLLCKWTTPLQIQACVQPNQLYSQLDHFSPTYTYPFYGQREQVSVSEPVKINIVFCTASLYSYLELTGQEGELLPLTEENKLLRDRLLGPLKDKMCGCFDTWDLFTRHTADFDTLASIPQVQVVLENQQIQGETFAIFQGDFSNDQFRQFHSRLQIFLLWLIEGSSYIDSSDPKWIVQIIVEQHQDSVASVVGYVTGYQFLSFPDKIRLRLSQFVIIPPYQGIGVGSLLYQTFFKTVVLDDPRVVEMTVEDPNDAFVQFRLRNDFLLARQLCHQSQDLRKLKFCPSEYDDVLAIFTYLELCTATDSEEWQGFQQHTKKRLYKRYSAYLPDDKSKRIHGLTEMYNEYMSRIRKIVNHNV